MDIESDIVVAHQGSPLGGNLPGLENSEATTRGAPFHNALQKKIPICTRCCDGKACLTATNCGQIIFFATLPHFVEHLVGDAPHEAVQSSGSGTRSRPSAPRRSLRSASRTSASREG